MTGVMKMKMTEQQFNAWASAQLFAFEDRLEGETETDRKVGECDDSGEPIMAPFAVAVAWRTARATLPDGRPFEATCQTGVEWPGTTTRRYSDEYETYDTEYFESALIEGVTLVDNEDEDEIEKYEAQRIVREAIPSLADIDFEALIPAVVTEDSRR
jgi:hypothetical protein